MKFLSVILFVVSFGSLADETKYSLLDDKLHLAISTELELLSEDLLLKRFGHQKVLPYAAFSDDEMSATFTITQFPTPANKQSMKKLRKAISNMLRKSNPKVEWKKDKLTSLSDTRAGIYEYESDGVGKYAYNITYALPVNDQLTFITFLTTNKKFKTKWRDIARNAFDSIEVTD